MKKLSNQLYEKWLEFKKPSQYSPALDSRTYTDADVNPNSTATISPVYRYVKDIWGYFNRAERRELSKRGYIAYNYESQTYDILK